MTITVYPTRETFTTTPRAILASRPIAATAVVPTRETFPTAPRAFLASRPIAATALVAVLVSVAVGGIILQQIVHTPWGLPGHRGLFWLAPLIAARWAIDRPSTALGIAAASSTGILLIDPSMGVHVASLLLAGFLVDLAASASVIRRHPWIMLPLAPMILLVNLMNPFVHNLALAPLSVVLTGMWFYVQGHLLWGAAAGIAGMGAGVLGRHGLNRLHWPVTRPLTAPGTDLSGQK
ncbi:MAG: hypothetical protein WAN20_10150 [Pseudonocardiaceae bacterium]